MYPRPSFAKVLCCLSHSFECKCFIQTAHCHVIVLSREIAPGYLNYKESRYNSAT